MAADGEILAELSFAAELIHWRGPSPYHFVAIPEEQVGEVRYAARIASYGWGVVPVDATVRGVDFTTSLFPRDGGYLLPIKDAVRKGAGLVLGETVQVVMRVRAKRR